MRIGLFGGSFDPVHSGHLALARGAAEQLRLDRVILLPTARPPHKPDRQFAPAYARYAMVELAVLAEERLFASAYELTLDRPAYTIDTVEQFRGQSPHHQVYLLLGADSFVELPTWRRWRELLGLCRPVVLARPGWTLDGPGSDVPPALAAELRGKTVHRLELPPTDASSTRIRQLLAAGEPLPEGWLPAPVLKYCRKYDLYR